MAVLTMPASPGFVRYTFRHVPNTIDHTSAFDGSAQTVEFPGAHWRLDAELPPMPRAVAEPWLAFLTELDGQAGRFYAGDRSAGTARGVATGTPLVNGASQTGKTLVTDGWSSGVSGILLAGDYFHMDLPTSPRRSLHKMVADANSDGGGNATLSIRPALRESPANNAPLVVADPTCVMKLIDDGQATWNLDEAQIYHVAFSAVESFTG